MYNLKLKIKKEIKAGHDQVNAFLSKVFSGSLGDEGISKAAVVSMVTLSMRDIAPEFAKFKHQDIEWKVVKLSNETGYIYPIIDTETLTLHSSSGKTAILSTDAAGLAASIYTLAVIKKNIPILEPNSKEMMTRLYEYMMQHPEYDAISAMLYGK